MRIIEGTVEEIVEYQRRTGSPGIAEESAEPDGNDPPVAVSASHGLDDDDGFYIQKHVYGRATSPAIARLVLQLIEELPDRTKVEVGTSEKTKDGRTDYLMVRDDAPQKYGAVAYIEPGNGRLTFRLRPEHVSDLEDEHIIERNVAPNQRYAIRYMLDDKSKLKQARVLMERALKLVR